MCTFQHKVSSVSENLSFESPFLICPDMPHALSLHPAVVMYDGNQRSKQYAFVTYEHNEATVRALNDRSMVIDGRLVDVRQLNRRLFLVRC